MPPSASTGGTPNANTPTPTTVAPQQSRAGPLTNDTINALLGRVDSAQEEGRLTSEQADTLRNFLTQAQRGEKLSTVQLQLLNDFIDKSSTSTPVPTDVG